MIRHQPNFTLAESPLCWEKVIQWKILAIDDQSRCVYTIILFRSWNYHTQEHNKIYVVWQRCLRPRERKLPFYLFLSRGCRQHCQTMGILLCSCIWWLDSLNGLILCVCIMVDNWLQVFFAAPLFPTSGIRARLRSSGSKQGGDCSGLIVINESGLWPMWKKRISGP